MTNKFIKFTLFIILMTLCACAKSIPTSDPVQNPAEVQDVWGKYLNTSQQNISPFRAQMSLRYGTQNDTRRVTALLWSNDAQELRLDVNAGIGVNIAKIFENKQLFLVYIPREEVAYYHQGAQKPLFNAGVPVPFNLQQLAQIIVGQYASVFGVEHGENVTFARDDNSDLPAYTFPLNHGMFNGFITLNAQGLPIHWQEEDNQGWSLSLSYRDNSTTPYKLSMIHVHEGKRAILLIKEQESPLPPFTDEQMRLTLPDNIEVLPLKEAQAL